MTNTPAPDVIIVGAGAAGLFAALTLSPRRVLVLSEKPLGGASSSAWAQGGFAAAVDKNDTARRHAEDTLKAAAGTANAAVVHLLTREAPRHVKLLEDYGVRFERDIDGAFRLSREACHGQNRVLKAEAGDGFGIEIMRALVQAVGETPSISCAAGLSAERLIVRDGVVRGVLARRTDTGATTAFMAPAVLLATGGIGGLFAATTNPLGAVGRGVAMAARAGALLSDLEFVQFHPTALDLGEDPAPLATEALRGLGAHLLNGKGTRFMQGLHELAELAPRDVVSRALFAQQQQGEKTFLDCRHLDVAEFPALLAACARAGLDPKTDLIPVTPAAHYHMGGISTDIDGRSSLPGLWAAGEVAATGLHGANRLASNSLMEAVVMGGRAARDIDGFLSGGFTHETPALTGLPDFPAEDMPQERAQIRQLMTSHVGVLRDADGLARAIRALTDISRAAEGKNTGVSDMALVACLIADSALKRTESRGGHFRTDCPATEPRWQKRSFTTLDDLAALKKEKRESAIT